MSTESNNVNTNVEAKYLIWAKEPLEQANTTVVSFRRKDTDKNPVTEADKYRAVQVSPAYTFPEAYVVIEGKEEATMADAVFQVAIKEAFLAAAGEILKTYCNSNPGAKDVPVDLFTFSAVVARMQAQQTSARINGEQILEWYKGSQTMKDAVKRYGVDEAGVKKQTQLREAYVSLASNNPGILPPLALKMIGFVNPEDAGSTLVATLLKKLETLSKKDTSDDL